MADVYRVVRRVLLLVVVAYGSGANDVCVARSGVHVAWLDREAVQVGHPSRYYSSPFRFTDWPGHT